MADDRKQGTSARPDSAGTGRDQGDGSAELRDLEAGADEQSVKGGADIAISKSTDKPSPKLL